MTRWSQIIAPVDVVHQLCPRGVASRSVEYVLDHSAGRLAPRGVLGNMKLVLHAPYKGSTLHRGLCVLVHLAKNND